MKHNSIPQLILTALTVFIIAEVVSAEPIKLHPENGHYFSWKGRPTILITSGEHYGGVVNRQFDYKKYFRKLQSHGFNLTRTFSGAYCEPKGSFNIANDTLSPLPGKLLSPWARSDKPGYANGGNKFDLTRWDPAYFKRLHDFITEAGKHGVVVEFVFFCPFYKDTMWALSPMNAANNINGIGKIKRKEVYTLKHKKMLAMQEAMVRKIVTELKDYDNLFYEICNEPYFGGVTMQWQYRIAEVIVQAQKNYKHQHLIAQNIANKHKKIKKPNKHISIFNFHYARPPIAVTENFSLNKVIGDDETGFIGSKPGPYRREAWDFIIAGGGLFDNLDYSFSLGHEDGTGKVKAPGTGGPEIQKQIEILLKDFINGFNFVKMTPDNSIIKSKLPKKTTARALTQKSKAYAIYINGPGVKKLKIKLPPANYRIQWLNTKTGKPEKSQKINHKGGNCT